MPDATQPPRKFEDSLAELEQIVEELEGGELGIDDALERYERGVNRLAECRRFLTGAEQRVEVLRQTAGGVSVEPFDAEATTG